VHATDRHEESTNVGKLAGFDVQDFAPLHTWRCRIGVFARCRACLATNARAQIGNHGIPRHSLVLGWTISVVTLRIAIKLDSCFLSGQVRQIKNGDNPGFRMSRKLRASMTMQHPVSADFVPGAQTLSVRARCGFWEKLLRYPDSSCAE